MRNKQPYIEGRIENLHVRVLRQEIETLVLFEIGGIRFRMRCRSFSFKQGDLVRVKYCISRQPRRLGSRAPQNAFRICPRFCVECAECRKTHAIFSLGYFDHVRSDFFRHDGILRDLFCVRKRRIPKPRRFFLHLCGACVCCDDNSGIRLCDRPRY